MKTAENYRHFLVVLGLLMLSVSDLQSLALAGWNSGGGELFEQNRNPWFLASTPSSRPIGYCVVRADNFALSLQDLRKIVSRIIASWQENISNAYIPTNVIFSGGQNTNYRVNLETRFTETNCNAETDVSIQFGFLDGEQEREFEHLGIDRKRYVALTIRTDYSSELRGRGFIYVAPDRGPHAFRGERVVQNAWDPIPDLGFIRIASVLSHEFGHMFGLQHEGSGTLMAADMPEKMVSSEVNMTNFPFLTQGLFFPNTQNPKISVCSDSLNFPLLYKFLGITNQQGCLRIFWNLNHLKIYFGSPQNDELVGYANFTDGGKRRRHQKVLLTIPEQQKVFPSLPITIQALDGIQSQEVLQQGVFHLVGGGTREIFVEVGPQFFQMGGYGPDGLIPDLLFQKQGDHPSGWED